MKPTGKPSYRPTYIPSTKPIHVLTTRPSSKPTYQPSRSPSAGPSMTPSKSFVIQFNQSTTRPSIKLLSSSYPTMVPTTRVQILESELYGNHSLNATEVNHTCPVGSKISQINGTTAAWIFSIKAMCDDRWHTVLDPFGVPKKGSLTILPMCMGGYNGWKIHFGPYIGQITLTCPSSTDTVKNVLGFVEEDGAVTSSEWHLSENQRIVGFRTYHNSSGIQSMKVLYADMTTDRSIVDPKGGGMLSFLWGILAFSVPATIAVGIIMYRDRRRHKQEFRDFDRILPLK
jgi:hypothetical protein